MEKVKFVRVIRGQNGYDTYSYHEIEGNVIDLDKVDMENEHFYAPYDASYRTIRVLAGKFLTLLDASICDKNQLKALKDLTKNIVADAHTQNSNVHYPSIIPPDDLLDDINDEKYSISVDEVEKEMFGE